jgi:hypothetical protein
MSLQNTYLTIWKTTVYHMTFNTASDILDLTSLMNFAKAFDKVLHQRLLCKLKFYGIKNETLKSASHFPILRKHQGLLGDYHNPFGI